METNMPASASSTLVTVWAYKRSCFLIKVSMTTSVRVLSYSLVGNTKLTRCRGALLARSNRTSKYSNGLNCLTLFGEEPKNFYKNLTPLKHSCGKFRATRATPFQLTGESAYEQESVTRSNSRRRSSR
jgi:hypothetical protein